MCLRERFRLKAIPLNPTDTDTDSNSPEHPSWPEPHQQAAHCCGAPSLPGLRHPLLHHTHPPQRGLEGKQCAEPATSKGRGAGLSLRAGRRAGRLPLTVVVAERGVDESGRRVEEDAEVEAGQVVGLHAVVLDGHAAVIVGPRVHVPAAMGRVQHVREAGLLQPVAVQRRRPAPRERGWLALRRISLGLGEAPRLPTGSCRRFQNFRSKA